MTIVVLILALNHTMVLASYNKNLDFSVEGLNLSNMTGVICLYLVEMPVATRLAQAAQ